VSVLLLSAGCSPIQSKTPSPPVGTFRPTNIIPTATPPPKVSSTPTSTLLVQFFPDITYQTMDGFGANCWTFPYANDLEWNWDAVKFVFDELDIAYLRLAPWLGWWETANDNEDPFTLNWDGFSTVYDIIDNHDVPFGQFLTSRDIELSVGVWDFGGVSEYCDTCSDWLASGNPRHIPPDLYPEMGESIASYILHMQENGVPIKYAEVQNEPDIEASIRYPNPEALRDAGKVLWQMLDHYNLPEIQIHGPNLHSPSGNVRWIETWLADETLRQRTVAVSYHTWWSEYRGDYEDIWQAAQQYNMPVWATEAGYSGSSTNIDPQKWLTAFGFAESYYRAIAWSHASRVYHWSLLGFDGAIGKQGERYPMFHALKHFTNYIPPGLTLIESRSEDPQVMTLAFARPDGSYSIILLNRLRVSRAVVINTPEEDIQQIISSNEKAYEIPLAQSPDGVLNLAPLSITSILIQP
jgi:hypothetical protein